MTLQIRVTKEFSFLKKPLFLIPQAYAQRKVMMIHVSGDGRGM
jgi:hypothetical protein